MKPSAILFDLDGTLVETIDLWHQAVGESLKHAGMNATPEQLTAWYSAALHFEGILDIFGRTEADAPNVRRMRDDMYVDLLRQNVEWLPGVLEVLDQLKAEKMPMGMITGSHRRYVDAIDERLSLNHYFGTIITADEMGKFMKPHPHGLFMAADALGVEAKNCIFVGDQLFDIGAAKAAGITAVLIPHLHSPAGATEEADTVIESLSDVLHIVIADAKA
ncbi:MAG: gph [Candidatus Peribacteria bacterium]|nr:gph [Candidatus Peribacteria bacterium]